MREMRTVMRPVTMMCEVKFYIEFVSDFDEIQPSPVYGEDGEILYFDTEEEAEEYADNNLEDYCAEICEKVFPIVD